MCIIKITLSLNSMALVRLAGDESLTSQMRESSQEVRAIQIDLCLALGWSIASYLTVVTPCRRGSGRRANQTSRIPPSSLPFFSKTGQCIREPRPVTAAMDQINSYRDVTRWVLYYTGGRIRRVADHSKRTLGGGVAFCRPMIPRGPPSLHYHKSSSPFNASPR